MVATADGARLTEAHRLAQAAIVRQAQTAASVVFHSALDPRDLDGSVSRYLAALAEVVQAFRSTASSTALAYYQALRLVEGVTGALPNLAPAGPVEEARLATSLLVTGPVRAKSSIASGSALDDALAQALVSTLGAVGRHVTNGQRESLAGAVHRDPKAHGYARITDGRPCAFCAMLVGRGPTYKSNATADFRAHDHCGCGVAPFFEGSDGWTAQARQFSDQYATALREDAARRAEKGLRPAVGDERLRVWRAHYDATRPQEPRNAPTAPVAKPKALVKPTSIDTLPRLPGPLDYREAGTTVNPFYGDDRKWGVNCVHVVNALELRRRGFDVTAAEATPDMVLKGGRNAQEALRRWKTPPGVESWERHLYPVGISDVKREVASWPPGARGWVRVSWSRNFGGGGHIFSVEKLPDGTVQYVDGQTSNVTLDLKDYQRRAQAGKAWGVVRMDDMEPTDSVLEFLNLEGRK